MGKYYLYIVLTRTNTIISRLIRFFKNDEYTHAAISLDAELERMYSFGRKYTFYPFIGRFKKESLSEGTYKYHDNLPGVVIEIEVSRQQYKRAKALIYSFASSKRTYKYNYKGLLYCLLNKSACSEYRFLCSEFVYYILKESGIADFNISRSLVRPQNFLDTKAFRGAVIYKGNLKEIKRINISDIGLACK
ncbi:MAG: hypothetical protein GX992_01605 [Clostridium sp.]|nr:hypothetical protein [Clostridium sp.]